jgi:predicted nucleic acid-binding protein
MTKAILDSNFLIALIGEKDKWTKTAISIQKALKKNSHDALMVLAAREMGIPHIVSFDQDFDEVDGIERIGKP